MSNRVTVLRGPDGRPAFAVLPWAEYERLAASVGGDPELAADMRAFDRAKSVAGTDLPAEMVRRIIGGESPVKVWRSFRGWTAARLAAKARISQAYISKIERGERAGSVRILKRLATALGCDVDDVLPRQLRP